MRTALAIIRQDEFSRWAFGGAVFWGLLSIFLLALFWFRLPPQIPLFYSHPWGEDQLTEPVFSLLLPGLTFLILVANLIISSRFFLEEKLTSRILNLTSSLFSFLAFYALLRIIFLTI